MFASVLARLAIIHGASNLAMPATLCFAPTPAVPSLFAAPGSAALAARPSHFDFENPYDDLAAHRARLESAFMLPPPDPEIHLTTVLSDDAIQDILARVDAMEASHPYFSHKNNGFSHAYCHKNARLRPRPHRTNPKLRRKSEQKNARQCSLNRARERDDKYNFLCDE